MRVPIFSIVVSFSANTMRGSGFPSQAARHLAHAMLLRPVVMPKAPIQLLLQCADHRLGQTDLLHKDSKAKAPGSKEKKKWKNLSLQGLSHPVSVFLCSSQPLLSSCLFTQQYVLRTYCVLGVGNGRQAWRICLLSSWSL